MHRYVVLKRIVGRTDKVPSQFYYDSNTKTTEALLDDPVAARTRVLYEAGALGFEPPITQQKTTTTPQNPSNITLPKGGKAIICFTEHIAVCAKGVNVA